MIGEYNVRLRCYVDSRPSPASLFWLTEPNVTLSAATAANDPLAAAAVPAAAAAGQYHTLNRVRFFRSSLIFFGCNRGQSLSRK